MVNPAVEYNAGEPLKLTLAFPLDYRLSKINGLHKRRLLAAPRLTVSGDASNRLRYYVSVFYNDKEGEINGVQKSSFWSGRIRFSTLVKIKAQPDFQFIH